MIKYITLAALTSVIIACGSGGGGSGQNLRDAEVGKLEGTVPAGQDVKMKIHYKWLRDTERSGVITYAVTGTTCSGEIKLPSKPAYTNVEGDAEIVCNFLTGKKQLDTQTKLQLFQGTTPRETYNNTGVLNLSS